ncbi:MAG: N-6 DNA methylase [Actinomycetota bacterium]|nr:N-6 DNA methylase [Actinomycetota bacterium]
MVQVERVCGNRDCRFWLIPTRGSHLNKPPVELHPVLDSSSGAFALETAGGSERKTTGSYYTPDSLVSSLLDTALDPVLDEASRKPDPEAALLDLKVCDPAVGSGHFLIRAAHRIARRLASVRTGDEEPAPEPYREALRDAIRNCVYGVDVNPMAAELCRFNLLLEGIVPGKPLSFLDHHVQVGNSLLGTTPDLVADGIPDDAFKPIEGDDKKLTGAYRKRNREERVQWEAGQLSFSLRALDRNQEAIEEGYRAVEEVEEGSVAAVREKAARYEALRASQGYEHQRLIYDAWCAAFVWPKHAGAPEAMTHAAFGSLTKSPEALSQRDRAEVERVRERYGLFHWHLAFPRVFEGGGFDVVLGNPPWERIKLQEQEWFAVRRPEIANAPNAAARKRMIKALVEDDPALHATFLEDLRRADGESHLIRSSGCFPLCGRGDINTYSIFAETNRSIISPTGRVGCIVPSGIATDNTTKEFFGDLVNTRSLASIYEFENVGFFGVGQGHMVRFALLTLLGKDRRVAASDFFFQGQSLSELGDSDRHFSLTAEDIRLLNPNTRTCPIFRSSRDAEIIKAIYRRVPVLIEESAKEDGNPWGITFMTMFHMSNDSGLFRTRQELEGDGWELKGNIFRRGGERYLPVYEAKMFHYYNHRLGDFSILSAGSKGHVLPEVPVSLLQDPDHTTLSRYWAPQAEVQHRLRHKWNHNWLLGWRDVTDARASARTVIFSVLPWAGVGNSAPLCFTSPETAGRSHLLTASLSSFALDFVSRPKVGGLHLNFFILKQLAVLPPDTYNRATPWAEGTTLYDWLTPRVLELTYTAWDLEPFACDLGYDGPPFRWESERRFLLRCELDAAFFHLYGIGRDDVDYIMETFPIVRRKDEAAHGEYRTKRVILETYDAMACAAETNEPYQTPLDPIPLELGASENGSPTVAPLRPRAERQDNRKARTYRESWPAEAPPAEIAAEEESSYGTDTKAKTNDAPERSRALVEDVPEDATPPRPSTKQLIDVKPVPPDEPRLLGEPWTPTERATPGAPNTQEATLALNACLPDGEKVEREGLLADAAGELGHPKLTKKVRRALNQALNAEHNAGRLKTDWQRVWRPRKK